MDAETFVHLLEVLVDGRGSDSELRGDLRVRPASCDVLENRALSRREPVESQIFLAEEEDDQFCRGCCASVSRWSPRSTTSGCCRHHNAPSPGSATRPFAHS